MTTSSVNIPWHLVGAGVNLALFLGAALVQLPQIAKICAARSAAGLSAVSFYIQTFSCACYCSYNILRAVPLPLWADSAAVGVQYALLLVLVWRFEPRKKKRGWLVSLLRTLAATALAAWTFVASSGRLPTELEPLLAVAPTFCVVLGKLPQIAQNWRQRHSGQLSLISLTLMAAGNVTRILSSLQFRDFGLTLPHALAGALNLMLVGQILYLGSAGGKRD